MSFIHFVLAAVFLALASAAPTMEGVWTGKYSSGNKFTAICTGAM